MENVIYIKYNKLRRPEFRISTVIYESNEKKYVVKKALTKAAESQISQIHKNSLEVGQAYEKLDILIPEYQEDRVIFDFVEGQNLEECFVEVLDDLDLLSEKIKSGLDIITSIHPKYRDDFKFSEAYKKVFGSAVPEIPEEAVSYSNIDVLFDNIIIKDEKYICLDCEWVFDFPIPVKFIKYRSLFYFYQKYEAYLKKRVTLEGFLQKFDITPEEKKVFMEMERNFQMYVVGKDFEYDYIYKYEKECLTINEAFVDRREAEQKEKELVIAAEGYRTSLESAQKEIHDKAVHIQNLEAIITEKNGKINSLASSVENLEHEMNLKEQHVQNLTGTITELKSSKWYKLQSKIDHLKKGSDK